MFMEARWLKMMLALLGTNWGSLSDGDDISILPGDRGNIGVFGLAGNDQLAAVTPTGWAGSAGRRGLAATPCAKRLFPAVRMA